MLGIPCVPVIDPKLFVAKGVSSEKLKEINNCLLHLDSQFVGYADGAYIVFDENTGTEMRISNDQVLAKW